MTDKNDSEIRLYQKVMGIEEARKLQIPMPNGIKIPKSARNSSSGRRCDNCGKDTLEGHEDAHGMWHYRCSYCVEHQDPTKEPCPRCGCTAHEGIAGSVPINFTENQVNKLIHNPFRPDVILFRCLNCSFEWDTPEFEKWLLTKAIKYVLPTSAFAEKP